jgi:hypothetical protein
LPASIAADTLIGALSGIVQIVGERVFSPKTVGVLSMVKEAKFFRKEADKAERAAGHAVDPERSAELRALALAYRAQAETIKKLKREKKHRSDDGA